MANNNLTELVSLPTYILLPSVVFKFIAMIIGVLGNITVIIYSIFLCKGKTVTSYLIGNLALADLLICLTLYPIWIIELIQTILNIDSDQDLFCKLSRSSIWSLIFASVATLLAITVDRYLFIVKPLKYPLIVTKRRVFLAVSGIWLTSCCLFILFEVYYTKSNIGLRSFCDLPNKFSLFSDIFIGNIPLLLIFILNFQILNVARKQRKRMLTKVACSTEQSPNSMTGRNQFFQALKSTKTFFIVVIVLMFCCLIPTVVGSLVDFDICNESCRHIWYVVFQYELYGINSIVNSFIYGMRHVRYRRAYGHILFKILYCHKPTN